MSPTEYAAMPYRDARAMKAELSRLVEQEWEIRVKLAELIALSRGG